MGRLRLFVIGMVAVGFGLVGMGTAQAATPAATASAAQGCSGDALLQVSVTGLQPNQYVELVASVTPRNAGDGRTGGLADANGARRLATTFDGTGRTSVGYQVLDQASGAVLLSGSAEIDQTCTGEGALVVTRSCATPDVLHFVLPLNGVEPSTDYLVYYSSDQFTLRPGVRGNALYDAEATSTVTGQVVFDSTGTDDEYQVIDRGPLDIFYEVVPDDGIALSTSVAEGESRVAGCPTSSTTSSTTSASQPAGTTTTTATSTSSPSSTTATSSTTGTAAASAAPSTSSAAADAVVVTGTTSSGGQRPSSQLALTGTDAMAMLALGAGLLAAGIVATTFAARRRTHRS